MKIDIPTLNGIYHCVICSHHFGCIFEIIEQRIKCFDCGFYFITCYEHIGHCEDGFICKDCHESNHDAMMKSEEYENMLVDISLGESRGIIILKYNIFSIEEIEAAFGDGPER